MDVPSVEVVVDLSLSLRVVAWVLAGASLGTISGLIPGLHANNFALVLAGVVPSVPGPPLFVGVAMLSAGVVHTFLNAVPAMALGVPDAETAVTALPGHRMVLDGRGYEAIRLSALGSVLAVLAAVPLAVPITRAVTAVYPTVRANLPAILVLIVVGLIASERTWRARIGGALSFALAAGLGALTLDLSPEAPLEAGGMLAPLFAGLFGAPVLIDAMIGGGVPPQENDGIAVSRPFVAATAVAGTLAGAIVGYLPGISAAIAALAVLVCLPGDADDRAYIVATSGVDTANTIFALFALVAIGQPRTGVMVAFDGTDAPVQLPVLVGSVVLAGLIGFVLVIALGDRYLDLVGRASYFRISVAVLALLVVLSGLFAGVVGVGVFAVAAAIGLVPVRFRARRVHLMGVLYPVILGV